MTRVIIWLSVLLVGVGCALFISYANWRQTQDASALQATQKQLFAKIDQQVAATKQKRIDDAQKAEAAAKAAAVAATAQKASTPATSSPSITTTHCGVSDPGSLTVIINKKHCFNPLTWAPSDLAGVDGYLMRSPAATAMQSMMAAASAAGVPFGLTSTYRSYANQVTTYNNWVAVNGSAALADQVSARPGYSEHQTGLAANLDAGSCVLECFGTTPQYQWLVTHAAEYGFIQRYPVGLTAITGYEAEAWHWRYVGVDVATAMKTAGIQTLEEYFGVSGGDYAN